MCGSRDGLYRKTGLPLVVTLVLIVSGCASMDRNDTLPTVPFVDLNRYAGTWHEIARSPMWFQRHCVDSKAIYSIREDGAIGVRNECVTDAGAYDHIEGVARVVDPQANARLTVVFDNFFARLFGSSRDGNYWVLGLGPDYRTAMVGTPDRRYLWILSRTPQMNESTYRQFVEQARQLGFSVSSLIRTRRPLQPEPSPLLQRQPAM
ncbi:MAG: lipocalin family protein [Nitrospira sp.]|nr:lipocalin family protein [Nitrospira sp.]